MPYLSSVSSYDEALNPTKAAIAKHTKRHGWFSKRCICGKRWGEFGCEDRTPEFIAYLQDSTEADRAEDLRHSADLFTTFEAEIIEANDQRSRKRRKATAKERRAREERSDEFSAIWQDSYPEPAKPGFWGQVAPTGTYEIIRQPALATVLVPRQRRPLPYPVDTGALA
ncbi:hypothetical protein [Glycomyces buryatensis]|uniref:Uncharacterized protein n=1 Tax=Glycomyces buryatensis TaxID=2570927 RepID=A0A4S8PYF8_9ACTN|nr:hypothetical protein [Glycomyces buryatensis]THV35701.1 hypothetical protein FAB82_22765 [Glycomyces buryatensis]